MSEPEEQSAQRRRSIRVQISTEVRMRSVTHLLAGAGADLSVGGIYVVLSQDLDEGTLVEVEFEVDSLDHRFDVLGEIRWRRQQPEGQSGRWGVGVKFLDLNDEDRAVLEELVEERPPIDVEEGGAPEEDRRDTRRVPISTTVRLRTVANLTRGAGADLSVDGIFLVASGEYAVGDTVDLEFTVEGLDRVFQPEGEVKWVRSEPFGQSDRCGLGIEFVDLDPSARESLESFVEERKPMEHA